MLRKLFFLCLFFLWGAFSCKKENSVSRESSAASWGVVFSESLDVGMNVSTGWLGSFSRQQLNALFANGNLLEKITQEMKRALRGDSSSELRFMGCEARGILPDTGDAKQCDYLVDSEMVDFEFSFRAMNEKNEFCMLSEEMCEIHQFVLVKSVQNGVQRPARFVFQKSVGETILILTHRVFYSTEKNIVNFLRRWTELDELVPLVVSVHDFPKEYGEEIAKALGMDGQQIMNLAHFSNAALKHYSMRKKPVQVSGIALRSAMLSGAILALADVPFEVVSAASFFKMGMLGKGALVAGDALVSTLVVPSVLDGLVQWRGNLNRFSRESVERKALESAILFAEMGRWAGRARNAVISINRWRAVAVGLSVVAIGNSPFAKRIYEQRLEKLVESLQRGNTREVRLSLCEMQKEAGLGPCL